MTQPTNPSGTARSFAPWALGGALAAGGATAFGALRGLRTAHEQTLRAKDYIANAEHNMTTPLPSLTVKTSYEKFANKLGASAASVPPAAGFNAFPTTRAAIAKSFSDVIADRLVGTPLDALYRRIDRKLYDEPEWKQNFQKTVEADPMLQTAHTQNPKILSDAFNTVKRFSPALAKDPLATRSLLKHVVMSGGEMDFGTMKMLAETEKFHREGRAR